MLQTILFLVLMLFLIITLAGFLISSSRYLAGIVQKKENTQKRARVRRAAISLAVVIVLNVGLVTISQFLASTPEIRDDGGNIPVNSIAELTKVQLNGREQWISIRGWDKNKPILLFLAGGPGGTQMAAVRHQLPELEEHFVMVNWDQPGSGKSYYAEPIKDITVDTYIQDGYALTNYLTDRFGQEKIFIVGESWGSALGIFLIDQHPDLYHGFIGTAQMIDFAETERLDYQKALEIARENNDINIIKRLEANGAAPYYGEDIVWKSGVYLNYLSKYMMGNPDIHNSGYNTLRDILSSEYGLVDKINYVRGVIDTFNHVYQQLYEIDMREDYTKLKVPVYFFEGRHDVNAPPALVEEYCEVLEAPVKEIAWFEHSGHSPWINEGKKFVEELLERFSIYDAVQ